MSVPSIVILPSVTSKNLGIRFISVDLPLPVLPITAVVSPAFAVKHISVSYTHLTLPTNSRV